MPPLLLTDSGLETWLVFHRNVELRDFAAFPLLDEPTGRAVLAEYFRDHLRLAQQTGAGLVLETPTWRANPDWGSRLGYESDALSRVNRQSVAFLRELAGEFDDVDVIVSGNIGPRGDGYNPAEMLSPHVEESYHRPQVESFAAAGADRVTMLTATHPGEATGVVRAAVAADMPVVIAFTVETDGRLPNGQALHEAIEEVEAATDGAALHYGINCAHPDHFASALEAESPVVDRIALVRANASRASHAELDEADELDDGDPGELGSLYADLVRSHPHLGVLGGCCGTDLRHIAAIAAACFAMH
jgi:homocysteine S-methyltransferase